MFGIWGLVTMVSGSGLNEGSCDLLRAHFQSSNLHPQSRSKY